MLDLRSHKVQTIRAMGSACAKGWLEVNSVTLTRDYVTLRYCTLNKQTNKQTNKHTYIHTYIHTHTHTYVRKCIRKYRQAGRRAGRQAGRQAGLAG